MKRPLSVTILSALYILMGTVGFIYHLKELRPQNPYHADALWIECVRILAIIAGIYMLKAANWARWLAIVWIAFHVAISFMHSWEQVVVHAIFLAIIAFLLTRAAANSYFHRTPAAS